MNDSVVPCRNDHSGFHLCCVPRRGNISLGTLKDRQRLTVAVPVIPDGITACDVSPQNSKRLRRTINFERNMIRLKSVFAERNQSTERMSANQVVQNFNSSFFKTFR